MPSPLLTAYIAELPRLAASESLLAAERHAVGAGRLSRGDRQRITGAWRRSAEQSREAIRPRSRAEARAYAGMSGIRVVPTRKATPDG